MRKIYKDGGAEDLAVAWIGESAPVPDGWHLDANSARDAAGPPKLVAGSPLPAPVPEVDDEHAPQKRKYTRRK